MLQKKEKDLYLEVLRLVACFFVVYNHTGKYGFTYYKEIQGGIEFYVNVIFACACKMAVPIFLMISGAVLLGKDESISAIYKKRMPRILCLIGATSVFYFIFDYFRYPDYEVEWKVILHKLYSTTEYNTYYLWLYLAFLIILPLLRKAAGDRALARYLIGVYFMLYVGVQTISVLWGGDPFALNAYMSFFVSWYICPLLGYYLTTMSEEFYQSRWLKRVMLVSILALVFQCVMCVWDLRRGQVLTDGAGYLAVVPAVGVFYLAKYFNVNKIAAPETIKRIVMQLSPTSLGTFIIGAKLIWIIYPVYLSLSASVSNQTAAVLWTLAAFLLCQCITYILRLIPVFRWML